MQAKIFYFLYPIYVYYLCTAITSIMAQFKNLNPYHWPGWTMAAIAAVKVIIVLLFFTEIRSLSHIRGKCLKGSSISNLIHSLQLKSFSIIHFLVPFLYIDIDSYIVSFQRIHQRLGLTSGVVGTHILSAYSPLISL